jgi:hypothetical protein
VPNRNVVVPDIVRSPTDRACAVAVISAIGFVFVIVLKLWDSVGRAPLIFHCIGKGSCETHGKRPRIRSNLLVSFWVGFGIFDGHFYYEFSATDILLGPSDLRSHVIIVESRYFDVHAFCHGSLRKS